MLWRTTWAANCWVTRLYSSNEQSCGRAKISFMQLTACWGVSSVVLMRPRQGWFEYTHSLRYHALSMFLMYW